MFRRILWISALLASPPSFAADPRPTAEEVQREDALIARLGERDPEMRDRLLALKDADHAAYLVQLARLSKLAQRYDEDPAFAGRVDQIGDLEAQVRDLAAQWKAATPEAQPSLRAKMVELVANVFELKQAERRQRIAEYQERLDRLEAEVADIETKRSQVIDHWVTAAINR